MTGLLSDRFDPNVRRLGLYPYPQGALSGQKGPIDWSNWVAPQFFVDAIKRMELPGRALRGENISADDVTKMALDTMGGGGLLSRAVPTGDVGGLLGINVFHGGPNRWAPEPGFPEGRPRMDKMGTGEGNQAYGRGFYSAEHPDVARTYQGKISAMQGGPKPTIDGKPIEGNNPVHTAAFELARHGGDRKAAADFHASVFKGGENNPAVKVLRSDQTLPEVALPGTLYKLDIPDADAAKYLDYDAPIKNQPKELRDALFGALEDLQGFKQLIPAEKSTLTGQQLYQKIVDAAESAISSHPDAWLPSAKRSLQEEAATEALRKAGIPGLKYFDQGSRGTREGLRNYVTWDQDVLDRIKILERDGKPLADRNVDAAGAPFVERNVTDTGGKPFLDLVESEAKRATQKLKDAGFSVEVNRSGNRFGKSTYLKIRAPDGRYGEIRVSDHTLGPSRYQDYVGHLKGTDEFGFKRLSYDEVVKKNDERLDIVINKIFKK
tara:strand:+ start:2786 stop:4264 length:1479 start_codon:yes stop_codon:yes gene_type:complete